MNNTLTIFTKGSELYVITEKVPEKPVKKTLPRDGEVCAEFLENSCVKAATCSCQKVVNEYNAAIEKLKASAIRVDCDIIEGEDYVNIFPKPLQSSWHWNIPRKEGELYTIEAEVEIKQSEICSLCGAHNSQPCKDHSGEAQDFSACNSDLPIAFLRPISKQEPKSASEKVNELMNRFSEFLDSISDHELDDMIAKIDAMFDKQEPSQNEQNWTDFWNVFRYAESKAGLAVAHEAVKRQFTITRR